MFHCILMGVVTEFQGAVNTFFFFFFTILNSKKCFTDLRKCMKWPLHLFYISVSCEFEVLYIIIVYPIVITIEQY